MSSTDRSGTLWSGFVAPVCAASLVAAVAVAMTASWTLQQLGAGPGVVASSEVFSWTESLNWRSAPTAWPEGQALANLSPEVLPSLVPQSSHLKRVKRASPRAIAQKSLARIAGQAVAQADASLTESQASDLESDQSRAQWLDLYRNWHSQFRVALKAPLDPDSAPQVLAQATAQTVSTQAEYSPTQAVKDSSIIQKRVAHRQKAIERASAASKAKSVQAAPVEIASAEKPLPLEGTPGALSASSSVSSLSSDQVRLSAASPGVVRDLAATQTEARPLIGVSSQTVQLSVQRPQVAAATESARTELKSQLAQTIQGVAQAAERKFAQTETQAALSMSSQNEAGSLASLDAKNNELNDYSIRRLSDARASSKVSIRVKAVDAFNEGRESAARVRTLSYQGSAQRPEMPWVRVEAQDSWPVIAQAQAGVRASAVPVLSKNSVLLLARGQGLSVMPSSALVYGKLPAGKRVRLSGRSEEALYWNRPDGSRWFMILNAAPGAAVLQLDSGEAVAVPALEATAVYLDLRDLRTETFAGKVFDGSQAKPTAVAAAWVSLVGQTGKRVQTDSLGRFRLEGVRRVGQYPLHLEVSQGTEFVHRYEVTQNTQSLSLFRFPAASIQTWVKQLEGGVSSDSGMVLAAFPGWSKQVEKSRYTATLHPVQVGQGLVPETYSLDSLDRLQPGRPLDQQSPRALAVQVPQGLNVLKLVPEAGKSPAWTQWVYSSPGVVNVILAQ